MKCRTVLSFLFPSQKVICKVVEKEYITKYDNIFLFHEIFQLGRPQNLEIKTKLLSWPVQKFKFYLSTKLENFMNIKNNTVPTPIKDAASYFKNFLGAATTQECPLFARVRYVFWNRKCIESLYDSRASWSHPKWVLNIRS